MFVIVVQVANITGYHLFGFVSYCLLVFFLATFLKREYLPNYIDEFYSLVLRKCET